MLPDGLSNHRLREDRTSVAATGQIAVGARMLHALSDGVILMRPGAVGTPEHPTAGYDALACDYDEVRLPIGCFLWRGERNVLIDAGAGPRDVGEVVGGGLLAALDAIDIAPEDIAVVALSHLHFDHVGGIADPMTGRPTFPNAQLHIDARDWAYFIDGDGEPLPLDNYLRAALLELRQRGQVCLETGERSIAPGLASFATPGHTPGHTAYVVHDTGDRVLLVGDAMHCPQQIARVEWGSAFDVGPVLAMASRRRLAANLAKHGGQLVGCHFPTLRPESADESARQNDNCGTAISANSSAPTTDDERTTDE